LSIDPTYHPSKQALRDAVVAARRRLVPEDRAARSGEIAARLVALDPWARAGTVGLYAPMGAEVDTSAIADAAVASGKRVAFPMLTGGDRALAFALCASRDLVAGALRTREPPPSAPALPLAELDLVLVPGVAFDLECRRLGRGRGHYDATLALLRDGAARVGLAFEVQLVPRIPHEPHDVALDAVITEARVLFPLPLTGAAANSSR
jgi:5-formyltetrahydrofolate cyclo-ligase